MFFGTKSGKAEGILGRLKEFLESSLGGVKQQSRDLVVVRKKKEARLTPHFSGRPGKLEWLSLGLGNPEGALWRDVEMGFKHIENEVSE